MEASVAILDEESKNPNLSEVLAVTLPDNFRSNKLLKKLGFSLTGSIEMYSMTSNLYQCSFTLTYLASAPLKS